MAKTFFHMVLRKFSEITNSKPIFSQYNIFYNYEYLFSVITKEVNQISNNVVLCCSSLLAVAMLFNMFS